MKKLTNQLRKAPLVASPLTDPECAKDFGRLPLRSKVPSKNVTN